METQEHAWLEFKHDVVKRGIHPETVDIIEFAFRCGYFAGLTSVAGRDEKVYQHLAGTILPEQKRFSLKVCTEKPPHIAAAFVLTGG